MVGRMVDLHDQGLRVVDGDVGTDTTLEAVEGVLEGAADSKTVVYQW